MYSKYLQEPKPVKAQAPDYTERPTTTSTIGVKSTSFQDQEAKTNHVEDWMLQRQAQLSEFENIVVAFTVSGNTSRHVGDLVRFEVPTTIPEDSTEHPPVPTHQLYGGYYIVSKIRHIITRDKFEMDVELIKNSFASRIAGQETGTSIDGTSRLTAKTRTPTATVGAKG